MSETEGGERKETANGGNGSSAMIGEGGEMNMVTPLVCEAVAKDVEGLGSSLIGVIGLFRSWRNSAFNVCEIIVMGWY